MNHLLEILGTLTGLAYLYFEYKSSIYLWITAIIMPAIYIVVYYDAGLYADFGINIYYLGAAVVGWLYWKYKDKKHKKKDENGFRITHTPLKYWVILSLVCIVTFIFIAWILIDFTDSNVPYLDSFTTALSIVGMWMLTKKYVEQWLVWIVVDVISSGLYIYKDLYFTAGLYALYTIIAIFGYFNWLKMMRNESK